MKKNIIGTTIIGLILFVVSILILFFNESNYVNTVKIANFVEKNAIQANSTYLNPANENKLIHVTGKIYSQQTLTDEIISIPKAIVFFRNVEIYQWEEVKKHHDDNKISYTYRKTWSHKLINSDNFESTAYKNPKKMIYEPLEIYAKNVALGKFYLPQSIISHVNTLNKVTQLPYNNKFKIYNGFYFTGKDYDNPHIGDQKLFYSYIPSGIELSIIAKQSGNHLENMNSKYGDFVIVMNGSKSLKSMLNAYRENNSSNTWLLRGIGILFMFIGLNILIQPISSIGEKVPILGVITQMAAFISTIVLTIALSTIIIAMSWLIFRPEIAVPLIIIAIFTILSLRKKEKLIIPG